MSTCGTCKHWADGAQGRPGYGTCQAIPEMDGLAWLAAPLALANNGDGTVSSWLETRAEFGCVLHETRPTSSGPVTREESDAGTLWWVEREIDEDVLRNDAVGAQAVLNELREELVDCSGGFPGGVRATAMLLESPFRLRVEVLVPPEAAQ